MRVYADNAATTKMSPTAVKAMLDYLENYDDDLVDITKMKNI